MKPSHQFIREVRMVTAEIRVLLARHPGATQRDLSIAMDVSQRIVNSRLQLMRRSGEVKTTKRGYGCAEYHLK